jgi:hypothetical protein
MPRISADTRRDPNDRARDPSTDHARTQASSLSSLNVPVLAMPRRGIADGFAAFPHQEERTPLRHCISILHTIAHREKARPIDLSRHARPPLLAALPTHLAAPCPGPATDNARMCVCAQADEAAAWLQRALKLAVMEANYGWLPTARASRRSCANHTTKHPRMHSAPHILYA